MMTQIPIIKNITLNIKTHSIICSKTNYYKLMRIILSQVKQIHLLGVPLPKTVFPEGSGHRPSL